MSDDRLVNDSPTPQHTLALLHGVQAGFLMLGFRLTVPELDDLGGPGLTSTPVTGDVAERIRAGVANPLLAAGVALAMFTGLGLRTLQALRLDALPPNQVVLIPCRRTGPPVAERHQITSTVPQDTTLSLHIPLPARPLIRAARFFLYGRSPDTRQRIFAGIAPMPHRITDVAERCGLALPRRPPHRLADIWLLRVQWERPNEASMQPTSTLR